MTPAEDGSAQSGLLAESSTDRASYWELVAVPIRRYRLVLLFAVLYCGLQVSQEYLQRPTYTSRATFRPRDSGRGLPASLARLANLTGIGTQLAASPANYSPDFFAEILRSRYVLDEIVDKPYELADGRTSTLPDLLDVRPDSDNEALRQRATRRRIRNALDVTVSRQAGLVTFEVTTRWPEVSYEVAQALLSEIDSFHSNVARNDARRERDFISEQLKHTKADVLAWEDSLQTFLASNRGIGGYSELSFQQGRIEAELSQRRSVHTQLQTIYLQAGISEARESPALLVLAYPRLPRLSTREAIEVRLIWRWLMVGTFAGTMLAVGVEWLLRLWDYQNPVIVAARETWPRLTSLAFVRARFWSS